MSDVPESLWDMSKYGFYMWDTLPMKAIGNKSRDSSSKSTSEKYLKEGEGQGGDNKEIVEFTVTDRANVMSVENGTTLDVWVFNVSD